MNPKPSTGSRVLALLIAPWIGTAAAQVTIVDEVRGFLGSNKAQITTAHNDSTEVSFDATGASKLVVAIGTEPGFNNQAITGMTLSFNGVPMNLAVLGNTRGVTTNDSGGVAIFYLDDPFQGAATFTFGATSTSGGLNGGIASIFGLAGTAAGVGNTSASWTSQTTAGSVSTSITTSTNDSWVLGAVQNSGTNNAAGTPTVVAPLTLGHNGFWGSQWGSLASGYQSVPTSGTTITPTFDTNAGGNIQIIAAEFPPPSTEVFQLRIAPSQSSPGDYDFEWDSQAGKVYDLLISTDLATPILTWPVYDPDGPGGNEPYADIPATGTTTTLTAVPGDGPRRFFAMVEKDAPPIFSEDFETDDGGFTLVGSPNDWAWETPNSDNNAGLVLTTGNDGSTGAWGTNLGAGGTPSGLIDPAADSILRSPAIDLTGVTGAKLTFAAAYDAAAGDVIQVLVREVGTNDQLGDPISPVTVTLPASSDWTTLGPFDLPTAADNKNIYLEFRYAGTDAAYIGLYIDDVTVTQ